MKIETEADACAALAVLIAGADGLGTLEEGAFLHDNVAEMPPFADLDGDGFARLMSDAAEWIWTSFPRDADRLSDDAIGAVLAQISRAIGPELRADALRMAVDLARADGISREERLLVRRLSDGLGLDPAATDTMMGPA